jgi:hypothetical protein
MESDRRSISNMNIPNQRVALIGIHSGRNIQASSVDRESACLSPLIEE